VGQFDERGWVNFWVVRFFGVLWHRRGRPRWVMIVLVLVMMVGVRRIVRGVGLRCRFV
jgi:hypothetical protein